LHAELDGGHDNPGFHESTADDALSHFTNQTEVCEASHSEYLRQEESKQEAAKDTEKEKEAIHVIFKHSQVSFDCLFAVAMIHRYPAGGLHHALHGRRGRGSGRHLQDLLHQRSVADQNGKLAHAAACEQVIVLVDVVVTNCCSLRARTIELVETDCTSIDTTIPEDEVAAYQRGLERQKEMINLERGIKEETPEEVSKAESEDSSTMSSVSNEAKEEEADGESKKASDFVDQAFKPVFSIA